MSILDSLPTVSPKNPNQNSLSEEQLNSNELENTILQSILTVANKPKPVPKEETKEEEKKDGKFLFLLIFRFNWLGRTFIQ